MHNVGATQVLLVRKNVLGLVEDSGVAVWACVDSLVAGLVVL